MAREEDIFSDGNEYIVGGEAEESLDKTNKFRIGTHFCNNFKEYVFFVGQFNGMFEIQLCHFYGVSPRLAELMKFNSRKNQSNKGTKKENILYCNIKIKMLERVAYSSEQEISNICIIYICLY